VSRSRPADGHRGHGRRTHHHLPRRRGHRNHRRPRPALRHAGTDHGKRGTGLLEDTHLKLTPRLPRCCANCLAQTPPRKILADQWMVDDGNGGTDQPRGGKRWQLLHLRRPRAGRWPGAGDGSRSYAARARYSRRAAPIPGRRL